MLRAWIDQGANWVGRRRIAALVLCEARAPGDCPPRADRAWVRNPIDNFIAAKLDAEKIAPSPEADKNTLLRRLSLDLTGLPPTPAEVDAFVNDNRPDAYERLVDRLLESPHYGEKWARPWLDLARYADSDGYEKDLVAALGLALPAVGDRSAESRHAVRRVHHRADRRRPAAECRHAGSASPPAFIATR